MDIPYTSLTKCSNVLYFVFIFYYFWLCHGAPSGDFLGRGQSKWAMELSEGKSKTDLPHAKKITFFRGYIKVKLSVRLHTLSDM